MKLKTMVITGLLVMIPAIANAFSNSLDGGQQGVNGYRNNFSNTTPSTNSQQNKAGQSYNPKEHTGFEHQDKSFPDPSMNDTRYNSNCQFGTCSPGGLSPNNK